MRVLRVPLVLVLGSVGCASVQPVREPAQFIRHTQPPVVYVTFKNHSKVTFNQPRVSGDSLLGKVAGASRLVGAPLSHIQSIEARQRNQKQTRWLIAGLAVATTGAFLAVRAAGSSGEACDVTLAGTYSTDPTGPTGDTCY